MVPAKIAETIDQVKNLFLGLAFLYNDKCVNAFTESKSYLHFALISIKSPPQMYYSIKAVEGQYLLPLTYYLLLPKNAE